MPDDRTSAAPPPGAQRPLLAGRGPLHDRLERGLREAIRSGRLAPGHVLPSTRGLAADLGASRGVVVEAYAQLRAEGWLEVRPGAAHRVARVSPDAPAAASPAQVARPRHDLRPGGPDPLLFPRARWAAALRAVLREAGPGALDYPDVLDAAALRETLAEYLVRVRGVRASPADVVVCAGVGHALALAARALHAGGARRVVVEDPSHAGTRGVVADAGLEPVAAPVDDRGLVVEELPDADAVLVTPAHQFPSGAALHPDRRAALVAWARRHEAVVLEDDYDAEYRYDRHPVGAVQGLDPARVVYCGSVSKTLSPALRLGYLRRSRAEYRRRRDVLVEALREHLREPAIGGAAAGLHLVLGVEDEAAAHAAAEAAGVGHATMGEHVVARRRPPALILGYARVGEPALRAGAAALGAALRRA